MSMIQNKIPRNILSLLLETILIIILYESLTGAILFIYNMVPITLNKVIYKITHTLLLNIIYVEGFYLISKLFLKKYNKISIN